MQVEKIITENYLQYAISGKLDSASAPGLGESIVGEMQKHSFDIIFYLKDLMYISSFGLRVFLQVAKTAQMNSTTIILSAVQPQVREIFDLSGFTQFFTFTDDLENALIILKENEKI